MLLFPHNPTGGLCFLFFFLFFSHRAPAAELKLDFSYGNFRPDFNSAAQVPMRYVVMCFGTVWDTTTVLCSCLRAMNWHPFQNSYYSPQRESGYQFSCSAGGYWYGFTGSQVVMGEIHDGRGWLLDWWGQVPFWGHSSCGEGEKKAVPWLFCEYRTLSWEFLLIYLPCLTRSVLCRFLFFC